jgi:hypothetical protein
MIAMNSFMNTVDIIIVNEKKNSLALISEPQPIGTSKLLFNTLNPAYFN